MAPEKCLIPTENVTMFIRRRPGIPSMMYVWGYCEGWETPEVIEMDDDGNYHRIADGDLDTERLRVLGPLRPPREVLGGDVRGAWEIEEEREAARRRRGIAPEGPGGT